MAAKTGLRELFHFPSLVMNPRVLRARAEDAIAAVLANSKSSAPLRALLERRSPMDFITGLHQSLQDEGLLGPLAADALDHVINQPSLAIRRADRDPRKAEILQAVAVEDAGEAGLGRVIVVVTATTIATKPPFVDGATAELLPADWQNAEDLSALCAHMEQWWHDYGGRSVSQPYGEAPEACAWLGVIEARASYHSIPPDWGSQLRTLAAVLGLHLHLPSSPQAASAQTLHDRVDFAIALNGASGWEDTHRRMEEFDRDIVTVGSRGSDFASLITEVRRVLITYVLDSIRPDPRQPRDLEPGEVVYHRKASPQPKRFDRFDAGSPQPCPHGAESYVKWGGDKAIKGMHRLYLNFEPRMLYHCKHYPNCKMYAVKA